MSTSEEREIRVGVVGLGVKGAAHARNIIGGKAGPMRLAAVCDSNTQRLCEFHEVASYTDIDGVLASGTLDGVIIATPHPSHPDLARAALRSGLHVLVEKPIAVDIAEGRKLIHEFRENPAVFAIMLNHRTDPKFRKVREIVTGGVLGEIRRITWLVTDCFRTCAYYRSGGWRGTWDGEGGGLLINQCIHHLDLLQWIFGMPERLRAFCRFGRYHPVEVEDEVTAVLEFGNGATGVFIASTGEAPGSNRLEVAGENGLLTVTGQSMRLCRNRVPMTEWSRNATGATEKPTCTSEEMQFQGRGGQHNEILVSFANAILSGDPLIAPAADGLFSLEIANAMLTSTVAGRSVSLPINQACSAARIRRYIRASKTSCG